MSSWLSETETANWAKCSAGLTVTKIGLSTSITKRWKTHLNEWEMIEKLYLPEFFEHIEKGDIKYDWEKSPEKKKKVWTVECSNQSCKCKKILDRLLKLHVNPTSIVWNPFTKPKENKVLSKLIQHKAISSGHYDGHFAGVCSVCREPECPFERHRKGITLFSSQGDDNVDKYYWKIANTFMFRGKERNSIANTGPEDTDSALIFKMMKNCELFNLDKKDDQTGKTDSDDKDHEKDEADNEIYDELLEVRNFLMHTPDNRLSDENLEECFKQMKTILQADKFQDDWSQKAVKELSKLQSMTLIMTSLTSEEESIVREAFAEQKYAVEYDINFTGKLKSDRVLEGILKVCIEMSEKYTGPEKKKDDNHGSSESNSKKGYIGVPTVGVATAGVAATAAATGATIGFTGRRLGAALGAATGATSATIGFTGRRLGAALGAAAGGFLGKMFD